MKRSLQFIVVICVFSIVFIFGCDKKVTYEEPTVVTTIAYDITQKTFTSGGIIKDDGGLSINEKGICYGTTEDLSIENDKHTTEGGGNEDFTATIGELTANTTYYYCAYATNDRHTGYGKVMSFSTLTNPTVPIIYTSTSAAAQTSAASGGTIVSDGGMPVTSRGVCWGTSQNPTVSDSKTIDGSGTGAFSSTVDGLTAGTTYYIRAYAVNSVGTSYGNQVIVTTSIAPTAPILSTVAVSSITQTTAVSGGEITSDGGATVTARGVCWSTSQNPTVDNSKTNDGTGIGSFISNLTGLTANTTYYVRAYASNSVGTQYGIQQEFKTLAIVVVPDVTTTSVTSVTPTTITLGGSVTSDGGGTVTERGICYGTTTSPSITGSHISSGSGTGTFSTTITGLTAGATYYLRAYATNSAGTSYGEQITSSTPPVATSPVLTTTEVSSITQNTASGGGNITSEGNATVTARGICWSTSSNPTISDNKTDDGSGPGSFSSSMTGLTAGTTYYVRAYATNSVGTAYGNQVSFTTLAATVPVLTTTAISSITQTTATSGGTITSNGGGTITASGICWGTSSDPAAATGNAASSATSGSFTCSITGLTPGTTYNVWAYATNSAGTGYGLEATFSTLTTATEPEVTTSIMSNITQTSATCGGNVTSDGGAAISACGVCWSTSSNPTISNNKTNDGEALGSYISSLTGLIAGTTYYVRAYATNSANLTGYGEEKSFSTLASNMVADIDGNVYQTLQIGTQVWLVGNLNTTKYNDGTVIPNVTSNAVWATLKTGAYCNYNNLESYANTYGRLYNWYAVNTGKLCPTGWHVATNSEWTTLADYLGGYSIAGGKLMEAGTAHWNSPNTWATNSTGFTALPGGMCDTENFWGIGSVGFLWTGTEDDNSNAWYRNMNTDDIILDYNSYNKEAGCSIRCVKD